MNRDIDEIIKCLLARFPTLVVRQLRVRHPGVDDDGLWYFTLPGVEQEIQVESSSGQCPFIIEHVGMKSSTDAWNARSVDEAVDMLTSYLLAGGSSSTDV